MFLTIYVFKYSKKMIHYHCAYFLILTCVCIFFIFLSFYFHRNIKMIVSLLVL